MTLTDTKESTKRGGGEPTSSAYRARFRPRIPCKRRALTHGGENASRGFRLKGKARTTVRVARQVLQYERVTHQMIGLTHQVIGLIGCGVLDVAPSHKTMEYVYSAVSI